MTRLFLVDDHTVLREGLRMVLANQPDLQVVGEAGSGEALLKQLAQTPAEVVVLDRCLPGLSGEQVTQRLQQLYPAVQVLVLSGTSDLAQVAALFHAGVRGYALKSVRMAELLHGIRTVAAGVPFLCSELGLAALRRVAGDQQASPLEAPPLAFCQPLTGRETEVLQLVAEGMTNKAIAGRLFTSTRTVETHRQNLMAKTQAKNTAALVKLAVDHGWLH